METTTTFDATLWLMPLLSGIAGALIGTFCGAYFLNKYQKSDKVKIREIAINAVKIFKSYKGKSFAAAQNEFNNKLSLSEKRAVIVALHKIGIPIKTPSSQPFNINDVCLGDQVISADYVDDVIIQLNNGLCDDLFFKDVDDYFSSNLRLMNLRKTAQRYVEKVLSKSIFINPNTIQHIPNWIDEFSPGEIESIMVFREKVANPLYYNMDGHANPEKLHKLQNEIQIGLWDNYLFWDFSSYQNINNQNNIASLIAKTLIPNTQSQEMSLNSINQ